MYHPPNGPKGDPKPLSPVWGVTGSAIAVLLSVLFWHEYPTGNGALIFGANALLYACVLAYWVKRLRKPRHLSAKVVDRQAEDPAPTRNSADL